MTPQPPHRLLVMLGNPVLADAVARLINTHVGGQKKDARRVSPNELAGLRPGPTDMVVLDPSEQPAATAPLPEAVAGLDQRPGLVAYASDPSVAGARTCLEAGFRAYMAASATPEHLVRALSVVTQGGLFVDRRFASALSLGAPPTQKPPHAAALSRREIEVLKRVAGGMSQKQIASELDISHKTVDTYRARGMNKLSLANRAMLVRYALERDWLD